MDIKVICWKEGWTTLEGETGPHNLQHCTSERDSLSFFRAPPQLSRLAGLRFVSQSCWRCNLYSHGRNIKRGPRLPNSLLPRRPTPPKQFLSSIRRRPRFSISLLKSFFRPRVRRRATLTWLPLHIAAIMQFLASCSDTLLPPPLVWELHYSSCGSTIPTNTTRVMSNAALGVAQSDALAAASCAHASCEPSFLL